LQRIQKHKNIVFKWVGKPRREMKAPDTYPHLPLRNDRPDISAFHRVDRRCIKVNDCIASSIWVKNPRKCPRSNTTVMKEVKDGVVNPNIPMGDFVLMEEYKSLSVKLSA
jgi:hypothetical protein